MYDVTATGELLIDFTRNSLSKQNNRVYEANPGGARLVMYLLCLEN